VNAAAVLSAAGIAIETNDVVDADIQQTGTDTNE
jgi:hypothetical protein